jgi:hypothetical protein
VHGKLALPAVPRRWWLLLLLVPVTALVALELTTAAYSRKSKELAQLARYREVQGITGFENYISRAVAASPETLPIHEPLLRKLGAEVSTAIAQLRGVDGADSRQERALRSTNAT